MRRGIWGQGLLGVVAVVLLAGGCSVDEAGLRNDGGGGAAGGGAGGGHAGAAGDGAGGGHAGAAGASATGGGAGAASVPAHFALTRGNVIPPGGASALLPDGRVFVLNGTSAQIFDPATETFERISVKPKRANVAVKVVSLLWVR